MEIVIALVVGFLVGCLVGANNANRTKAAASAVKAEATAVVEKAKDAAQ